MTSPKSRKAAVVGCSNVGLFHARALNAIAGVEVAAVCDLNQDAVAKVRETLPNAEGFTDFTELLEKVQPEFVAVATGNAPHAALTLQAAKCPSVRGIYVEKPMAVSLGDARAMVAACEAQNICLVVNHQRRRSPTYLTMRRLMDEGAIGEIRFIRATCAGDFLSDGTHLVDTTRFLLHDEPLDWVVGQVYRDPIGTELWGGRKFDGKRFGHNVESGAIALAQFKSGVQVDYHTGNLRVPHTSYHDITVVGTEGELHACDGHAPVDLEIRRNGAWENHPLDPWPNPELERHGLAHVQNYQLMLDIIDTGEGEHPMGGAQALLDMEIVTAIYESARLHRRLTPPIKQDAFPLDLMVDAGVL